MTNKYTIDYQGLSLGQHDLSFDFSDDLFALYEESPIKKGSGTIDIMLDKHASFMELEVDIDGLVEVECDRCTDFYEQPIHYEGDVVVKISERVSDEESDEDIIWLSPREPRLDLRQWLYESVLLSLPLARLHPDRKDCNPEILKYINQ